MPASDDPEVVERASREAAERAAVDWREADRLMGLLRAKDPAAADRLQSAFDARRKEVWQRQDK